jgi:hypothetical protein
LITWGLDRDVQSRDQVVGDQACRLDRGRPGDADPLPLTARELMRITVERIPRQTHQAPQLGNPVRDRRRRAQTVDAQRLGQGLAHADRLSARVSAGRNRW